MFLSVIVRVSLMATHRVSLDHLVLGDGLGLVKYLIGDTLGSRAAVGHVVLDTEVVVGAARIMAGGEEDAAISLALADDVGSGGGGKDAVLANDELLDAVRRADFEDGLNSLLQEEATITTYDDRRALGVDGVEDGLNEVLRVVLCDMSRR